MQQDRHNHQPARRTFLKLASVGAVAGSAAAVVGSGTSEAAEVNVSEGRGYRETEHVKKVYETARF